MITRKATVTFTIDAVLFCLHLTFMVKPRHSELDFPHAYDLRIEGHQYGLLGINPGKCYDTSKSDQCLAIIGMAHKLAGQSLEWLTELPDVLLKVVLTEIDGFMMHLETVAYGKAYRKEVHTYSFNPSIEIISEPGK